MDMINVDPQHVFDLLRPNQKGVCSTDARDILYVYRLTIRRTIQIFIYVGVNGVG